MKRVIISWAAVMGILILGMFFPFNGKFEFADFLIGTGAGGLGVVLGMWENKNT